MENNKTDHINRAHASKSSSSAPRVMECPASYILSLGLPERATTSYSEEGTEAHEMAEQVIQALFETCEFPEFDFPEDHEKYVEMFEAYGHACSYAQYAYDTCKPYLHFPHKIFFERRLSASDERDIWGSVDFIFIADIGTCLKMIIDDYKYGVGVKVDYSPNWQLVQYAWGGLVEFAAGKTLCDLELIIHQPRVAEFPYHAHYNEQEILELIERLDNQYKEIESWEALIGSDRIKETITTPEQRLLPLLDAGVDLTGKWQAGKHCQFCKHKNFCSKANKEKVDKQLALYKKAVTKLGGKKFPGDAKKLEQQQEIRNLIAGESELIKDIIAAGFARSNLGSFLQACYDYCLAMAKQDTPLPGTKLVEGESNDSLDIIRFGEDGLEAELLKLGVTTPTVVKKSFVGVTQLKKQFGREEIEHLLAPKETVFKVVPSEDEKEAVSMKAKKNEKVAKALKGKLR